MISNNYFSNFKRQANFFPRNGRGLIRELAEADKSLQTLFGFLLIIFDGQGQGLRPEVGAVHLVLRQAA